MAKDTPYYEIVELVSQIQSAAYYILETLDTIDGLRTRVHRGGFKTEEEARNYIDAMKPGPNKWAEIKRLCGHWRDGSQQGVSIGWDDATQTAYVKVGKKLYYGGSLDAAMDAALRPDLAKE